MKDAEQMKIEYLYQNGIPNSSIWLCYSGKEVKFDKCPDTLAKVEYTSGNVCKTLNMPLTPTQLGGSNYKMISIRAINDTSNIESD